MYSVGVFLEKEINGKPFHIFSFLSETDNSSSTSSHSLSIDSGGGDNNLSLQTRFLLCPNLRHQADRLKEREYSSDGRIVRVSTSPYFFSKETADLQVQFLLEARLGKAFNDQKICKHPVLPIFWCNNEKSNDVGSRLKCGACEKLEVGSGYYLCETCGNVFHKECVEAPLFIIHPSYPSLSLQLYSRSPSSIFTVKRICIFCETRVRATAYYCPIYKVSIHMVCALKPIPIIIDHFKRHPHPLTYFPRQASLLCNICGVIKEYIPTYVCARCVFVVHRDCIYFPYVISICRHDHRISFTYSLPPRNLSCGVCRRNVDIRCGAYSCNKCDGSYFVHTRCALRRDLWDGKELEGEPEELEIVEDPFMAVAGGEIIHFSHGHHLKLEICTDYDEDKYCQACVLPIYEGSYYSCVEDHCSDFILHETCANAPRRKRHPLHAHSLTLKVVTNEYSDNSGFFRCDACMRYSNGFVYEASTAGRCFTLDVRCALISEPFKYEGHDHLLFLALSPDEEAEVECQICHDRLYRRKLNCIECDFIICFRCATLPYKAKYKHDKHFITFRKELVATDQSDWCESCEKEIVYSGIGGYYACDEYCCTTLHVDCLLGKDPYMKHGQMTQIISRGSKYHILRNNTMSRPTCSHHYCKERCPHIVFFKAEDVTYCSYYCLNR